MRPVTRFVDFGPGTCFIDNQASGLMNSRILHHVSVLRSLSKDSNNIPVDNLIMWPLS